MYFFKNHAHEDNYNDKSYLSRTPIMIPYSKSSYRTQTNASKIVYVDIESFRANKYSTNPFRMIGLINVAIEFSYGLEIVTLPFYRSSGTNNGKIKGLWYPIVGIKIHTGYFTEFTNYINSVLSETTNNRTANKGWLAKSLFFYDEYHENPNLQGFSRGSHYNFLLKIGKLLRSLYENSNYVHMDSLNSKTLNSIVMSEKIYKVNSYPQKVNYENFIKEIFEGL